MVTTFTSAPTAIHHIMVTPFENMQGKTKQPSLLTPLCLCRLIYYLQGYNAPQLLINGFTYGFVIPTDPVSHDFVVTNHQSVFANPDIVAHKLVVEI